MSINKRQLYQTFDKSLRRNERLTDLATRKALDLPVDDDMQIITNNTRSGLGRCGTLLLSLAMLAGGGGATFGLVGLLEGFPRVEAASDVSAEIPAAQEFKITFWAEDGQPLEVREDE